MRWRRWIWGSLLLAAIAAALIWAFMPPPVLVELAPVIRGPLRVTVEEEGRTRIKDRYVVSAPMTGTARRIELEVGDAVRRGQVLTHLDPLSSSILDPRQRAEAQAQLAAAESRRQAAQENARSAEAEAHYWEEELKRLQELYERGIIPRAQVDHAESQAQQSRARQRSALFSIQVARAEVEAARSALSYSAAAGATTGEALAIRSPVTGQVLKVHRENAGVVSAGEALIEIGNPDSLEVEVELLSADAVRLKPGTRVLLQSWGGSGPLEARVRTIEPIGFTKTSALGVEEQRVLIIADFVSPPAQWRRLGHGYRVEASFVLWEADHVLQVPGSALFRSGEGWAVFVVEQGIARLRRVQLGQRSSVAAEIRSGLREGEKMVMHPGDNVSDGARVKQVAEQ